MGGSELCWHLFFHANTRQDLFVVVDRVDVFPPFFSGIIGGVGGGKVERKSMRCEVQSPLVPAICTRVPAEPSRGLLKGTSCSRTQINAIEEIEF